MDDVIKVKYPSVTADGQIVDEEWLYDQMEQSGWTDDPGTGKAVLLPDGSEVLNPTPMAPPIDYDSSPSAFDLWQANLQRMANIRDLRGDTLLDESEEDSMDFDVGDPEDFEVRTVYELISEAPSLRRAGIDTNAPAEVVSPEEAKRAALEADSGSQSK